MMLEQLDYYRILKKKPKPKPHTLYKNYLKWIIVLKIKLLEKKNTGENLADLEVNEEFLNLYPKPGYIKIIMDRLNLFKIKKFGLGMTLLRE